jgi:hypothetical protein
MQRPCVFSNAKPHLRDLAARGAPTEDRGKLLDEGITNLGLVVRKNSTTRMAAPVAAFALRSVERIAQALRHPQEGNQVADAVRAVIERITPTPALRYCLLIKPVPALWGTSQPRFGCAIGASFSRTPHFGRRPRKAVIFHPQPKNLRVFAFHSPRRFAEVSAAVRVARQQPTMGSRCASDYCRD